MDGAPPRLPPHPGERLRLAMAARVSRCVARAERALPAARDPAHHQEIPQYRRRTCRDRARHAQARCRCRGRGAIEALHDDHAAGRARYARHSGKQHLLILRSKNDPYKKAKRDFTMSITRRHILATIAAASVLGTSAMAQAADTVRIGLPTKTYWPTTIAETAVRQKLFDKEGIKA